MDDRFPKYLRWISKKIEVIAVPNLGTLVAGLAILAFVAKVILNVPMERFVFDPELVLQGEWWRLFSFPLESGLENPIWLIFYVLYVYFVLNTIEEVWGAAPLTLYLILGYIASLTAAFITGQPISLWFYILQNVSLAFGTLFPEFEMYLYFIIPVKAKWLAVLAGVFILIQFVMGSLMKKLFLAIVLTPYFLFFAPILFSYLRNKKRKKDFNKKFDPDMWR
jgi:hypothetical protein